MNYEKIIQCANVLEVQREKVRSMKEAAELFSMEKFRDKLEKIEDVLGETMTNLRKAVQ